MKGNYPEAEKLIDCLKAVINQQKIPQNDILMNWELFYRTADFHHISNMIYYAVLGMQSGIAADWAKQFSNRYLKSVIAEEQYHNLVEAVLWNCEENEIHIMTLDDIIYKQFYPMPEMRLMDRVEFLVEGKKRMEIDRMMYRLDFIPKEDQRQGTYCYTRSGITLIFHERIEYGNSRLNRYFNISVRSRPREIGKEYIHCMAEPELFVFLMCNKAQRFADSAFELRDMVDIWLYYRAIIRGDSWRYIMKRLEKLKVWDFTNRMLVLTDVWFGGGGINDDTQAYMELVDYILTKGIEGQHTAMQVLPLLKQTIRRKEKAAKKAKRKKVHRWMFPDREYMLMLYPRLARYRILLPVCWLRRLIRSLFIYLKYKSGKHEKKQLNS